MSGSSDPRRLLEYGDALSSVLKGALEAERASAGPDGARMEKIARGVALSVGGGGTIVPVSVPRPAPHAPPPVASGGATTPSGWLWSSAAAGAFAVAVVFAVGETSSPRSATPARTPNTVAVAPRPLERASASTTSVRPEDLPSAAAEFPHVQAHTPEAQMMSAPRKQAPEKEAPRQEDEEILIVARAHDRVRANPAEALTLCREHESKFESGQFAQEREAIAIEALFYLDRRDEAAQRFAAFRSRYPASSHRVHLESLLSR